jgi:methionyl-tRNA formyltransferase
LTIAPPEHPRRLAYLGTPEMAVPPLRALAAAGFEIPLVVSRPDKRRGRGSGLSPSPVKAAALELGLPVTDDITQVTEVRADLGVVVAYGRLIKADVLDQLAMVNLHFSLLPRWRGAAPVERAILAGDHVTGVCVMAVDESLDTGAVYRRAEVPIGSSESADELRAALVAEGSSLLVDALQRGLKDPDEQVGEATYAEKLSVEDLHLDWARSGEELSRVVRVGGAWTTFRGKRLKVWEAEAIEGSPEVPPGSISDARAVTGDGWLSLKTVQPEGKGRQAGADWARGARPGPDDRLGS